ncbi:MAG: hypothetical protein ABIH03_08335 [Pseudomonadota bacterium]
MKKLQLSDLLRWATTGKLADLEAVLKIVSTIIRERKAAPPAKTRTPRKARKTRTTAPKEE